MSQFEADISKRRTFAIISHPDAGKTTITEKLLLLGQLIQVAGSVKGKGADRHARAGQRQVHPAQQASRPGAQAHGL